MTNWRSSWVMSWRITPTSTRVKVSGTGSSRCSRGRAVTAETWKTRRIGSDCDTRTKVASMSNARSTCGPASVHGLVKTTSSRTGSAATTHGPQSASRTSVANFNRITAQTRRCERRLRKQHDASRAAGGEEPKRVHVRREHRRRSGACDEPQPPVRHRRGRSEHITAGENETDDERRDRALERDAPPGFLIFLPQARNPPGDRRCGSADRRERDERTREARDLPANEAGKEDVRPGRSLRDREEADEVVGAHPAFDIDHEPLHLRHDRGQTAERNARQQSEVERKLEDDHRSARRAARYATRSETGMTKRSGIRPTPTARNVPATKTSAACCFSSGLASLMAVAMKRPAPAAPTPVTSALTVE